MNVKSDKYDRQKLLRSHRYLRKNLNSDVEEKITMLTLRMMKKTRLEFDFIIKQNIRTLFSTLQVQDLTTFSGQ